MCGPQTMGCEWLGMSRSAFQRALASKHSGADMILVARLAST